MDYFLSFYGRLLLSSLWLCCFAPLFSLFSLFRRFVNPESSWVQGKRTNTRVLNKEQSIGAPLNLPASSPLSLSPLARPGDFFLRPKNTWTDLGASPELTCRFLIQVIFCKKKKKNTVWFIGVGVKHETRLNNSC